MHNGLLADGRVLVTLKQQERRPSHVHLVATVFGDLVGGQQSAGGRTGGQQSAGGRAGGWAGSRSVTRFGDCHVKGVEH